MCFFFNDTATTEIYTLSLHDALPIFSTERPGWVVLGTLLFAGGAYFGYLTFGHVQVRVGAWLDPFSDYDAYYQVINAQLDRKSTRLNSSHANISYAVFCLKKKTTHFL